MYLYRFCMRRYCFLGPLSIRMRRMWNASYRGAEVPYKTLSVPVILPFGIAECRNLGCYSPRSEAYC
ncbi:ABH_G0027220.mRNA.1.CDS.1 [Saccharomyces cerevisiae]|nr:ABH_G0027220.mRNA.1.CDS.1 [Saccharomyces cerevisiae]CAI6699665.1 ABH_G0027220.mRNA.1.CDS.1 [Saccharomyces cerevisiae]